MKYFVFTIIIFISLSFSSCEKNTTTSSLQSDYDKEIFDLINNHRVSIGLDKLEFNEVIWNAANEHSQNMVDGTTDFGHDGFNERIESIKNEIGGNSSAENVAMGYTTTNAVVTGWLNSPGHKNNIEGNYTHSAVSAVKNNNGTYYYTQIFINK